MPDPESAELKNYVEQLHVATLDGTMRWKQVNPTTFVWDTRVPRPARLSLQRLERQILVAAPGRPSPVMKKVHNYIFQAFETELNGANIQRLGVTSTEDDELNKILDSLFQAIEQVQTRGSLDFLKTIIPPKQS